MGHRAPQSGSFKKIIGPPPTLQGSILLLPQEIPPPILFPPFAPPPPIRIIVGLGRHRRCKRVYVFVGLALVGNDAVKLAKHCVSYTTTRVPFFVFFCFFFWGGRSQCTMMVFELGHIVRGGERYPRTRGMVASRSVNMIWHPRGSYIVVSIAVSGVATPENIAAHLRCHP